MYDVSVIISTNDDKIINCLNSVLNQTLKNIEVICIYEGYGYPILENYCEKDKRIRLISKSSELTEVNGQYVLIIDDVISSKICQLLFNHAKINDLDLLYVPRYEFLIGKDNKIYHNGISQLFFTKFYKKSFFNFANDDLISKCKHVDFFDKNLYSYLNFNVDFIENNLKDILETHNNLEINQAFLILIDYLDNFPLNYKQVIYNLIKNNFKCVDLDVENQHIFKIILNNSFFLDFLSEYKLCSLNYNVYTGKFSKNQNYKLTVVIPIFNNETLIHRTLMSIENQTFNIKNIEVLMIDDASSDNTPKIINNYAKIYPNFKAIHIKDGTGSAGTPRNLGLHLASADYVIFIDHDDFFEIDALEKLYKTIVENNCDFVYGTYALIDGGKPIKFIYPNEKHGLFKNLEDNNRSIITPPSLWTKLFKKEFLLKNNILFPTILGEDAIFVSKALREANGVYYLWDDIICYYNLNENSFTSNLSYDYFVEGFISEEYLFNLYSSWDHKDYYGIRGQGILDYYINRFMHSKLDETEIKKIFPLFYEFCNRLFLLNISPKQDKNQVIFDLVIKKDVGALIKYKNYGSGKFKYITNKILNKINKHGVW